MFCRIGWVGICCWSFNSLPDLCQMLFLNYFLCLSVLIIISKLPITQNYIKLTFKYINSCDCQKSWGAFAHILIIIISSLSISFWSKVAPPLALIDIQIHTAINLNNGLHSPFKNNGYTTVVAVPLNSLWIEGRLNTYWCKQVFPLVLT